MRAQISGFQGCFKTGLKPDNLRFLVCVYFTFVVVEIFLSNFCNYFTNFVHALVSMFCVSISRIGSSFSSLSVDYTTQSYAQTSMVVALCAQTRRVCVFSVHALSEISHV